VTNLRQGAWINSQTGNWAFIDEHANWAKREGNLQSLGMPSSVRESIREIPNDYGGENRKKILLIVMAAGGIRMRGHDDVVVFEFTIDAEVALPACRHVLQQIAGKFTQCQFNDLAKNKTLRVFYANYVAEVENPTHFNWQTATNFRCCFDGRTMAIPQDSVQSAKPN